MTAPISPIASTSTRHVGVPSSAIASHVASGFSALPADQFVRQTSSVRFGSDEPVPAAPNLIDQALARQIDGTKEAAKIAATHAQALALFTRFKNDQQGLIRHLAGMGVAIYTGDDYPGVDVILANVEAAAMVHYPNRLWGKPPHNYDPDDYGERWEKNLMGLYRRAEEDDQVLMLVRSNPEGDDLLHETYHVLQAINGLKPCSSDDHNAQMAKEVMGHLIHGLDNIQFPETPVSDPEPLIKAIPGNPHCQGLVRQTIAAIKLESPELQEAIRMECRQEADVRNFLSANADAIGLTFKSPVEAAYLDTEAWVYNSVYNALNA